MTEPVTSSSPQATARTPYWSPFNFFRVRGRTRTKSRRNIDHCLVQRWKKVPPDSTNLITTIWQNSKTLYVSTVEPFIVSNDTCTNRNPRSSGGSSDTDGSCKTRLRTTSRVLYDCRGQLKPEWDTRVNFSGSYE